MTPPKCLLPNPEPPIITPDEPPFGHRMWYVAPIHGIVTHDANLLPNIPWQAVCGFNSNVELHDPSESPHASCTCGFYLFYSFADLVKYSPQPQPHLVYSETYYWGRVIEHTEGVRAQFVYPKTFYLHNNHHSHIPPLLERYGAKIEYAPELYFVPSTFEEKVRMMSQIERRSYLLTNLRKAKRALENSTKPYSIKMYTERIKEIQKLMSKFRIS
jgi:hypothetical protein